MKLEKRAIEVWILMMALNMPFAFAQEKNETGINPDSIFYSLDKALDRISITLAFDDAEKASMALSIAEERLVEAKSMLAKGKLGYAGEAGEEYGKAAEIAERSIETIQSSRNPERAIASMEKLAKIQNQIERHRVKVTETRAAVLEMQSQRMTAEQISQIEKIFGEIGEKAADIESKSALKKENAKIKYRALFQKRNEEIRALEEQIDNASGLSEGRRERAEKAIETAESALAEAKKASMAYENSTALFEEERLKEIENWIETAKRKKEAGKTEDARDIAEEAHDFGNEVSFWATRMEDAKKEGNFSDLFAEMKKEINKRGSKHKYAVFENLNDEEKGLLEKPANRPENAETEDFEMKEEKREKENTEEREEKKTVIPEAKEDKKDIEKENAKNKKTENQALPEGENKAEEAAKQEAEHKTEEAHKEEEKEKDDGKTDD